MTHKSSLIMINLNIRSKLFFRHLYYFSLHQLISLRLKPLLKCPVEFNQRLILQQSRLKKPLELDVSGVIEYVEIHPVTCADQRRGFFIPCDQRLRPDINPKIRQVFED